ncbi:Resistance to inhibitors of cholinesterase protein 3 [Fasciola gigantica]|uniref:Resistance to inhibitors of cholinesterase protein 3 n=1 Tax=Fasciola gigantica TaxID=46835 RepID=A0A504XIV7_FASGI|nr:Resistance to inhibitors of cholinesterase protein 3 [Fasciola gigantica]
MSESSIRLQTYIVCGVMIGCFSILYPKIFHPMLLRSLGAVKTEPVKEEHIFTHRFGPNGPDRPRPSIRGGEAEATTIGKRGGILSLVLPLYGVGIVIYLFYTLSKLYKSRKHKDNKNKDEYLKHYYRDFHYDVNRGKFRMGRDSTDDDDDDRDDGQADAASGVGSSKSVYSPSRAKQNKSSVTNAAGDFDWSAAYGPGAYPDIYRSAKSLPRDLEDLLYRMENEEVVDNEELSSLRLRLEQTERQMMHLLHAMDAAEHMVAQSGLDDVDELDPFACDPDRLTTSRLPCSKAGQIPSEQSQEADLSDDQDDCDDVEDIPGSEYESGHEKPIPADTEIRQRGKTD